MNRNDILSQAQTIINGARQESYGDAFKNFQLIANLWSPYLNATITPKQVADMMILLKIARNQNQTKEDNYIDICGYAALGAEVSDISNKSGGIFEGITKLEHCYCINVTDLKGDNLKKFFDPIMDSLKDNEISMYINEFDKLTYYVTNKNVFKMTNEYPLNPSLETILEKSDTLKSESQNKPHTRIISFGVRVDKSDSLLKVIKEKLFINDYLCNNKLDALIFRSDYDWNKDDRNYDKFYLIHNKELYYFNVNGYPRDAHYNKYYDELTCEDIEKVADEICNYLNSLDDESYKYFLRDSKKVED